MLEAYLAHITTTRFPIGCTLYASGTSSHSTRARAKMSMRQADLGLWLFVSAMDKDIASSAPAICHIPDAPASPEKLSTFDERGPRELSSETGATDAVWWYPYPKIVNVVSYAVLWQLGSQTLKIGSRLISAKLLQVAPTLKPPLPSEV